ncbi:MAG: CU044_2847 family protein [Cyanobacteria bacterium P01_A01_bin.15]
MGTVKPFQLDDSTIIYVQTNDDIDTTAIAQALETDPNSDAPEDDLELPAPTPPDSDSDEELEDNRSQAKGWQYPNRHGAAGSTDRSTTPSGPTPAQRVGTLVKAYTTHVIKDIRDTALTEVQIEKVALEFGIGLDTTAQIPYIASSSAKCSIKVTIECKLTPPPAAQATAPSSNPPSQPQP